MKYCTYCICRLQQHLPFTVLKPYETCEFYRDNCIVATAPTVYGIETIRYQYRMLWNFSVATAPTVYGIETVNIVRRFIRSIFFCCNSTYRLRYWNLLALPYTKELSPVATAPTVYGIETPIFLSVMAWLWLALQQHLPFTVLKLRDYSNTVLRQISCNSTYRLRYWNMFLHSLSCTK